MPNERENERREKFAETATMCAWQAGDDKVKGESIVYTLYKCM